MRSLAVPACESEQMDDADLDPATYARVLTDLARVNRWTLAARPTLDFVARIVGTRDRFTLLDVGFGDGDLLRKHGAADARFYHQRGIDAVIFGIGGDGQHGPDEYADLTTVLPYHAALTAYLNAVAQG